MAGSPSALVHAVVTVDGPAGAGKSTTSRGVATRLGLRYLDTGAMYRAITFAVLESGTPLDDEAAVVVCAQHCRLEVATDAARPRIFVDGRDVSSEIRTGPVTAAVSQVSAIPAVRAFMVDRQRDAIGEGGIVVEGRDIGTAIAPDAGLKIFLSADPAARAARRAVELSADAGRVEADLARRDSADSSRAASPLACAPDAVVIDSTASTLDEVIDAIVRLAIERFEPATAGSAGVVR